MQLSRLIGRASFAEALLHLRQVPGGKLQLCTGLTLILLGNAVCGQNTPSYPVSISQCLAGDIRSGRVA